MKIKKSVVLFTLLILGFLIYGWSVNNGFIWDDEEQIVNNQLIQSLKNLPLFFQGGTFSSGFNNLSGLYFRPLMTTCFSLIYSIFNLNPGAFHLIQALIHIVNSFLFFLIINHFLKKDYLSFILSLVFLIHPINTETVLYASNLQDVLFFFFGSLGFYSLLKKRLWLCCPFFFLSLLSKETGIIFIILGLIYLLFFNSKQIINYLGSSWLILISYSILRFGLAKIFFNKQGLSPITLIIFSERIKSIPKIISYYLITTVYPANLSINQVWIVTQLSLADFYWPLIITIGFIGGNLLLYHLRPNKITLLFLFWFWLSLILHLQIFPLDLTASPRFFYLPLSGLLGLIGLSLTKIKVTKPIKLLVLTVIISLSIRTLFRVFNFKDGLTFYAYEIKHSTPNFNLENNYGVELFRHQQYEASKPHFIKSIELAPHWWPNWNNLGAIYEREQNYQKAKQAYLQSINNGHYYLAYQNLISLYSNKLNQPEKAQLILDQLQESGLY